MIQRCLNKDEEAAHIDIFPLGVSGDAASAPDAQAASLVTEIAQHVDVVGERIENVLFPLVNGQIQIGDAKNHLVGRGLVNASLNISPRVYASHVTAWWDYDRTSRRTGKIGITDDHSWEVQRGIVSIIELTLIYDVVKRRCCSILWVKDGEAVLELLTLPNQRVDNRLIGDARGSNDADLLDIHQRPDTSTQARSIVLPDVIVIGGFTTIGSSLHDHVESILGRRHGEWRFCGVITSRCVLPRRVLHPTDSDKFGYVVHQFAKVIGCGIIQGQGRIILDNATISGSDAELARTGNGCRKLCLVHASVYIKRIGTC